ncbi:MAG: restriction endonuclease subunit M [Actinomycetota bacterium]
MPPKKRSSDLAAGKMIPALVNQGYFSEYYLAYRLDSGLQDLYKRWDATEKDGYPTPRTRLRSLPTALDKYRLDAALTAPEPSDDGEDQPVDLRRLSADGVAAQRDLNDAILTALGWAPTRGITLEMVSGDRAFTVPVAGRCETHAGTILVALDTVFATDPSTVVVSKQASAGTLLDPIRTGDRVEARTALEAAQTLFTADDPPNYLLLVSGGSITLLDRDRWGEGIYLAANIDDALARHDTRPRGELAALAALFSADVINPGEDAKSLLADLLEAAANESAGVSKDLRHGVRRSVELLANAVVRDVRERQKGAWRSIDPKELTRQCLRYLYRIIVLLFAEARPELGILPVDDPDYQSGYSLARLRDVALRDLHTDHGRNAHHVQDSLALLFRLVNDGYEPEVTLAADEDGRGLRFRALRSVLFSESACPLIDRSRISDAVLQKVFEHLCFSPERTGKQRQALSYATLGLNQLGAVYEGLMAYSGFLATEPLYEVDKHGDADNGSWVIPVTRSDEYPDDVFLTEEGPGGEQRRVRYETGDFVFRLSGRDRQRSASYYTPEVLTEFTVRHALDVFFAENPDLRAADILNLTVCEPALGSGAFLNEAINQLAARYLKSAQDETGEVIDPDRYQHELQKAKAHFAVNQAFGVDLNQTAVELAEVSLWLNCMHAGLDAPWFGARLRRGNSLIGGRRATYTVDQVKHAAWIGKQRIAPTEQPPHQVPFGEATGIHHFLVPGEGWGSVADAAEIKELDPGWVEAVQAWRNAIHGKPNRHQADRLVALAGRVEALWKQAAREVGQLWDATRQHIAVRGSATLPAGTHFGDETIRRVLYDPRSAACRLRRLMDAWCSLWMWGQENGTALPTLDEWLDGVDSLLGRPDPGAAGVLFLAGGTNEGVDAVEDAEHQHPWLVACREIADRQAWFHWELDFGPIFQRGGFDVQIGNPPWVRPIWIDEVALAEHDPWFGLTDPIPEDERRSRRQVVLGDGSARSRYLADRAENHALNALMGSVTQEPLLAGLENNLYLQFITGTWRRSGPGGTIALLHPEGHLGSPKASTLRAACYRRLRAHYHFINELLLFREISDTREYGVHVYGDLRERPSFRQAAFLYHPSVVDRSLQHDGEGELPGRKFPEGGWDIRPHRQRFVEVDEAVLAAWAALLEYPDTASVPLIRNVTTAEAEATEALANYPRRLGGTSYFWTRGFDEQVAPKQGLIEKRTALAMRWEDVLLQGPHFGISTPFAKEPRASGANQQDYDARDLRDLPEPVIPRTNWQRKAPRAVFDAQVGSWNGRRQTEHFRLIARRQVPSNMYRSVFMSLLPPGPTAVSVCYMGRLATDLDTTTFCGLASSLPADFFARIAGVSDLHDNVVARFPVVPADHPLASAIAHRVLRLNCLTHEFAEFWRSVYQPSWSEDQFVLKEAASKGLTPAAPIWTPQIPVRSEGDRWLLLTELDALAALVLGISEEALLAIYRSQFPVLRSYEHVMVFDSAGSQICGNHNAYGYDQALLEARAKAANTKGWVKVWDRVLAWQAGDTSVDLGPFVPPFRPADRQAAMSAAYRVFSQQLADA